MEKIENVKGKKEEGSSILKAAWLIALVTILSKVVGFLRDVITVQLGSLMHIFMRIKYHHLR